MFSVQDVLSGSKPFTKEQGVEMFSDVFNEGLGLFEGKYHIRLNDSVWPVQHAPRRGHVALRAKMKESLEELHNSGVTEPVSRPTPWISSMLAVPKKNGEVRICLDPKDLNKAILREKYPSLLLRKSPLIFVALRSFPSPMPRMVFGMSNWTRNLRT